MASQNVIHGLPWTLFLVRLHKVIIKIWHSCRPAGQWKCLLIKLSYATALCINGESTNCSKYKYKKNTEKHFKRNTNANSRRLGVILSQLSNAQRKTCKFAFDNGDEMTPKRHREVFIKRYCFFFSFAMCECKVDLNKPTGKHFRDNHVLMPPAAKCFGCECVLIQTCNDSCMLPEISWRQKCQFSLMTCISCM